MPGTLCLLQTSLSHFSSVSCRTSKQSASMSSVLWMKEPRAQEGRVPRPRQPPGSAGSYTQAYLMQRVAVMPASAPQPMCPPRTWSEHPGRRLGVYNPSPWGASWWRVISRALAQAWQAQWETLAVEGGHSPHLLSLLSPHPGEASSPLLGPAGTSCGSPLWQFKSIP